MFLRRNSNDEDLKLQRSSSLRRQLVTDVTRAAMGHATGCGLGAEALFELAHPGIIIVSGLESSLTRDRKFDLSENATPNVNWKFWRHDDQPQVRIKARDYPYMSRDDIEEYAYNYLDLPYRAPLLERTIVDILIALEFFAFAKEMFEYSPPGLRWLPKPKRQRDLLNAMRYTYGELAGSGPISTRRLREVATRSADSGVAWPAPLFLILDDNITRTGRI